MDVRDLRPPVEDGPWPPLTHLPPLDHPPLRDARTWTRLTYAIVGGYRPMVLDLHVPTGVDSPPVVAESSLPGPVHDVVAAVRYLRRYAAQLGVDATRLGLWGDSAGGHLVTVAGLAAGHAGPDGWLLGATGVGDGPADVSAVVSWYGASDLTLDPSLVVDLWPDTSTDEREELARRVSPVHLVRADSPPMLLMHGDADSVSPVEQSVRLHEAALRVGACCELVVAPGSEHVFHGEPVEPFWDRAITFLQEHLLAPVP